MYNREWTNDEDGAKREEKNRKTMTAVIIIIIIAVSLVAIFAFTNIFSTLADSVLGSFQSVFNSAFGRVAEV